MTKIDMGRKFKEYFLIENADGIMPFHVVVSKNKNVWGIVGIPFGEKEEIFKVVAFLCRAFDLDEFSVYLDANATECNSERKECIVIQTLNKDMNFSLTMLPYALDGKKINWGEVSELKEASGYIVDNLKKIMLNTTPMTDVIVKVGESMGIEPDVQQILSAKGCFRVLKENGYLVQESKILEVY